MGRGGFNFDAKLRRQSIAPDDLLYAHVGGVDILAQALLRAEAMVKDDTLGTFQADRYAGWRTEEGERALRGDVRLSDLAAEANDPAPRSGRQERLEAYVSRMAHGGTR